MTRDNSETQLHSLTRVTDGESAGFRSFLTKLLAANGVELTGANFPGWIARPAAALLEGSWRLLGIKSAPPLT